MLLLLSSFCDGLGAQAAKALLEEVSRTVCECTRRSVDTSRHTALHDETFASVPALLCVACATVVPLRAQQFDSSCIAATLVSTR